ncbi:hypothetical protein CC85DRAFT_285893 [Cutaneotrichosporon oleaginosum]|uniref:Uncharacterized protein n=1 Tax=Cutaneotrichosporon oleaginosum TaxID=879819 RepID=A0A0J0XLZ5_9TREE|nr:uncharacterized protein CC85DRAFT_285893 [Cutaneotrichosporon oleaginosum]KLT42130.1 hypothetical protein CC85DRAFT_285893 [Cutaneotrichosporon oleaginosum]TXT04631.1 hypothetical protein COLE_07450 [Cutaneotrichosporon oleaginosum]
MPRIPDPEAGACDFASVFDSSPPTSAPSRASSPTPSDTSTLSPLTGAGIVARAAFHLLTFTAGLYLASGVFTSLAPLLDDTWLWAPAVFTGSALATLLAPFWGLLLLHLFSALSALCALPSFLLSSSFRPSASASRSHSFSEDPDAARAKMDAHTRKCLISIGVGLGLATLRVLVALATFASTLPCTRATLSCAADAALALARDIQNAWEPLAPGVAATLVPLAAAWWYTAHKRDVGGYVFTGMQAASVALALVNVWTVLALGRVVGDVRAELETCRGH